MINRGELDIRLDPFYYKPEFLELEKIISTKSTYKLRNYILYLASGATPHKAEAEKYYSDEINGIPFLRVQNVTPSSQIQLQDVKYINLETHNGMLNRSRIKEDDLLVKITGVGRMAVSSVVPKNFEGNINQHLVVIRTENKETSEILAAFLNSDIGETLAKRRSTGGTRPALDYMALRSIPIVFDKRILEIQKQANQIKKQKEAEAAALLASIDDYLLQELGITLPPASEKKTFFIARSKQLSGERFDPFYHQIEFDKNRTVVKNGQYEAVPLKNLVEKLIKGKLPKDTEKDGDLNVIQINSIAPDGHIDISDLLTAKEIFTSEQKMQQNDVLVVITGATIGKIAIWELEENENYYLGGDIVKFQCLEDINPYFVFAWLRCQNSQIEIKRNVTGATNGHLSPSDIGNILIPCPSIEKQTEIANHISAIRSQAKQLQQQAAAELEQAKQQVEKLILGE